MYDNGSEVCELCFGLCLVVIGNKSDINIDTGGDGNVDNILNSFNRGVKLNNSLVNTHFEVIPGLGTYITREM